MQRRKGNVGHTGDEECETELRGVASGTHKFRSGMTIDMKSTTVVGTWMQSEEERSFVHFMCKTGMQHSRWACTEPNW